MENFLLGILLLYCVPQKMQGGSRKLLEMQILHRN